MKNGKRPTKRQKEAMIAAGLNDKEWLVTKNLTETKNELHIVHRNSEEKKVIFAS